MYVSSQAKLCPGSEVCFENLFTSFSLLDRLSSMEIAGTGTVRQNCLHKVDIVKKKDFEKKMVERGANHMMYREDQVLVAWKDNKAVYVASNKYTAETGSMCKYDRSLMPFALPPPHLIY